MTEYREADVLIKNGTVVTMNEGNDIFDPGYVAIEGSKIIAVGNYDGNDKDIKAKEVIDASGCVILPGLINCHTHAAMTLFRGLADDLPLMEWLQNYIFPAERKLTEEWVYWGTKLACAEMIMSGTTTFCDMYIFEGSVARAADECGMRALVGEVLYDFPSPNYGPFENGLIYTEELINQWQDHDRISIAVEPHAVYTCSPDTLRQCFSLAEKHDVPLVIHLSETEKEVEECVGKYGKTPVQHLASIGFLSERLIAAHCVVLSEDDKELLASEGVKVVHNPESNLKLGSGVADVPELLKMGITVSLGTDGCASNNDLDMIKEMDICAKIHKGVNLDPTVMPAEKVLKMATCYGAICLGANNKIGFIEAGALADLIILDFRSPHLTPCYNPISHLVYAARGSDVRDVMINGTWVMRKRELIGIDLDEIVYHVQKISTDIRKQ